MAVALILGSTGKVGSSILSTLRNNNTPQITNIQTVTRRDPPADPSAKIAVTSFSNKDTTSWAPHIASITPAPSIVFSGLATTRGAAGGFDKQYKIDHDLNVELAKAAKEHGAKVHVLISAATANTDSMFGYSKMKGELEEHIKELGFDHVIFVRPGLIAGEREETRFAEGLLCKVAGLAGSISNSLKDFWAQDADVIAKAAVAAGLKALNGEIKDKVYIVGQSEIVRLGRTEWKDL